MSDDEKLNLRDLPPVPPVPLYQDGKRASQTLLKHADSCLRSAYLYLKHQGGAGSHAMDRGSLVHAFAERMMLELIQRGETSLYAAELDEDPVHAENAVASLTAAMVEEIANELNLHPVHYEFDAARAMAFHIAIGLDVDPGTVVGVERKFVLDLDCGVTVSGKIDLASLPEPGWGQVDDYKTSHNVPTEEVFEQSFQTKLYATLMAFGNPVENRTCPRCSGTKVSPSLGTPCPECDGRGKVEVRLEPFGATLHHIRARELYPRARLREEADGTRRLVSRERILTRTELADFKADLERIARKLQRAIETWKFPAVPSPPGGYCSECPSPPECPLPAHLRRFAGTINTPDEAAEALAWALRQKDQIAATEKEVKAFVGANGPIVIGGKAFGFTIKPKTGRRFRQKGGRSMLEPMLEAVEERVRYGSEFNLDEFTLSGGVTNEFGVMQWSPEQVAERRAEVHDGRGNEGDADEHGAAGGDAAAGGADD